MSFSFQVGKINANQLKCSSVQLTATLTLLVERYNCHTGVTILKIVSTDVCDQETDNKLQSGLNSQFGHIYGSANAVNYSSIIKYCTVQYYIVLQSITKLQKELIIISGTWISLRFCVLNMEQVLICPIKGLKS